mmetsp:Transcript_42950/g.138067  ORF Transcript_42950/g.138067 Transcript_42950/m.138067 type:complete len:201 (+) Transcript_42950:831-1433(+)
MPVLNRFLSSIIWSSFKMSRRAGLLRKRKFPMSKSPPGLKFLHGNLSTTAMTFSPSSKPVLSKSGSRMAWGLTTHRSSPAYTNKSTCETLASSRALKIADMHCKSVLAGTRVACTRSGKYVYACSFAYRFHMACAGSELPVSQVKITIGWRFPAYALEFCTKSSQTGSRQKAFTTKGAMCLSTQSLMSEFRCNANRPEQA